MLHRDKERWIDLLKQGVDAEYKQTHLIAAHLYWQPFPYWPLEKSANIMDTVCNIILNLFHVQKPTYEIDFKTILTAEVNRRIVKNNKIVQNKNAFQ